LSAPPEQRTSESTLAVKTKGPASSLTSTGFDVLIANWSSHELGWKARVNCEIGLLTDRPKLAWVEVPAEPGKENNLMVFRGRLKPAIRAMQGQGVKRVADGVCGAEPDCASIKDDFDPDKIKRFKTCVSSRHKNCNFFLKNFHCLTKKFHRGVHSHKTSELFVAWQCFKQNAVVTCFWILILLLARSRCC
jgi:hypothetical protein